MKEDFFHELEIANLKAGILGMFNEEKLEEARVKHFSKLGRLEEYREYKKECENTAIFKLNELMKKRYDDLRSCGIGLSNDGMFLLFNGEPVAVIAKDIIPLKGKKQEVEEALDKLVELTYPEDDFFANVYTKFHEIEEFDLEEEMRRKRIEDQLMKEEVKWLILEALANSKEVSYKKLGIIPSRKIEAPEQLLNFLGNYSSNIVNSAIEELEEELGRRSLNSRLNLLKKKLNKKNKIAIGLLTLASLSLGLYVGGQQIVQFIQQLMPIPEEKKEPYKEVGGTDSEIKTFLIKYPWASNINQTTIDFFLWWKNATELAEKTFSIMKDVKKSVGYLNLYNDQRLLLEALNNFGEKATEFVSFVKENNCENAIEFLTEFPQFKNNYEEVLPVYSKIPNVVKNCWNQIKGDKTQPFNPNFMFLELMRLYKYLNVTDDLPLKPIQILNNATIGGIELGLPKMSVKAAQSLVDAVVKNEDIVNLHVNIEEDRLKDMLSIYPFCYVVKESMNNTKFIYYFLAQLLSSNYESVMKYPLAAREFAKQVDQILFIGWKTWPRLIINYTWKDVRNNWDRIFYSLDKLWKTQVEIYEKGEGFMPLDEKLARMLFNDTDVLEMIYRETLLPRDLINNKIVHTQTIKGSIELSNVASIETLISNIEKFKDYHDLYFKVLTYRANDTEDLIFFARYILGITSFEETFAKQWAKLLKTPDPIKIFLISFNRELSLRRIFFPTTVSDTIKYRKLMIENGTEVPWVNIYIRGNETLSPTEMNAGESPEGIAPIQFRDGRVRWEQIAYVIQGLAMYIYPEKPEISRMIGCTLLYPLPVVVASDNTRSDWTSGIHITDSTYKLLSENVGPPLLLPFKTTTTWTVSQENNPFKSVVYIIPGSTGYLEVKFYVPDIPKI
ncbi:MAG: hypothetical protein QW040_01240 [Candidatus Aenigmatarchaeota archaeon]